MFESFVVVRHVEAMKITEESFDEANQIPGLVYLPKMKRIMIPGIMCLEAHAIAAPIGYYLTREGDRYGCVRADHFRKYYVHTPVLGDLHE